MAEAARYYSSLILRLIRICFTSCRKFNGIRVGGGGGVCVCGGGGGVFFKLNAFCAKAPCAILITAIEEKHSAVR